MPQDVIVKKDSSTILSKVIEINNAEIKYKKWNNQEGSTYSISRSEVSSINYQNGTIETITINANTPSVYNQQPSTSFKGYMDDEGTWGRLRINGRTLSDQEVRNMVSPQNYELYLKAKRQNTTGIVFIVIGGVSLGVAASLLKFDEDFEYLPAAGAFTIASALALPTGLIFGISGGNKMKRIAQEYNRSQGKAYSLNISPSLMKCDTPQLQGNCGLGLTLTMNF